MEVCRECKGAGGWMMFGPAHKSAWVVCQECGGRISKVSENARGWAIYDGGTVILMRTVSDTRRAAIINWLCTEGGLLAAMNMTDDFIEDEWQARRGSADAIQVSVSRIQD